jgi:hypothetical protein
MQFSSSMIALVISWAFTMFSTVIILISAVRCARQRNPARIRSWVHPFKGQRLDQPEIRLEAMTCLKPHYASISFFVASIKLVPAVSVYSIIITSETAVKSWSLHHLVNTKLWEQTKAFAHALFFITSLCCPDLQLNGTPKYFPLKYVELWAIHIPYTQNTRIFHFAIKVTCLLQRLLSARRRWLWSSFDNGCIKMSNAGLPTEDLRHSLCLSKCHNDSWLLQVTSCNPWKIYLLVVLVSGAWSLC